MADDNSTKNPPVEDGASPQEDAPTNHQEEEKKKEWEDIATNTATTNDVHESTTSTPNPAAAATTTTTVAQLVVEKRPPPQLTWNLFLFWVLPVLLLACFSDYGFDEKEAFKLKIPADRETLKVDLSGALKQSPAHKERISRMMMKSKAKAPTSTPGRPSSSPRPSPLPSAASRWPTSYKDTIATIEKRGRKIPRHMGKPSGSSPSSAPSKTPSSPPSSSKKPIHPPSSATKRHQDPQRHSYEGQINAYRKAYDANPDDVFAAIKLADALRFYDVTYHDGGTKQPEAIETYHKAIALTVQKRQAMIEAGDDTALSANHQRNVRDEVLLDYSQKSVDGLLCALYTALGKILFMANMFEKAVDAYSQCLEIEPLYLDALGSRGSSLIILGRYEDAGQDFLDTIEHDEQNFFMDAYTGLARILQAKESYIQQGWDPIVSRLGELIPSLEGMISSLPHEAQKKMIANNLNRLHHVMFTYHDVKTKDTSEAWHHLARSYKFKMSALPPWQSGFEQTKISQTMQIFHKGFWPDHVGSPSQVPIFIIGFVRSGSTLLERVLDAHPAIVGTGEDSVFNGRLDKIRNEIVSVSVLGDPSALANTVEKQADLVVEEMKERWKILDQNTAKASEDKDDVAPQRFVDKMLNNYYNVGFIHMLFPKALILHVIREPMDTIFSAYKHEFPPGTYEVSLLSIIIQTVTIACLRPLNETHSLFDPLFCH